MWKKGKPLSGYVTQDDRDHLKLIHNTFMPMNTHSKQSKSVTDCENLNEYVTLQNSILVK